jgi:hypothetical protein
VMTKTLNADDPLPPPLHSLAFQQVDWRDEADLVPVGNEGWRQSVDDNNRPVWVGTPRAGRILFDWSGTGLVAVLARAPDDRSRLRVCIDGAAFQTLDASIQPKREIIILAEGLAPGRHTVELVPLDDAGRPGTTDDGVRLVGLGSIGVGSIGQGAVDSDLRRKREM